MRIGSIKIGIFIFVLMIFIWIIKNNKKINDKYEKILNKLKAFFNNKIVKFEISIIFLLLIIVLSIVYVRKLNNSLYLYNKDIESSKMFEDADNKIVDENKYYNELINKEYDENQYKNPYIPEGFKYVEGTYNTGFVIEDSVGNQFVWIPCANKDNKEVPKLQKRNFSSNAFISKDSCYDIEYKKFIESALMHGGYYISRYELGIENDSYVSKNNKEVKLILSSKNINELIEKKYENLNYELINGYAYDTAYSWIMMNNELNVDAVSKNADGKIYTGRNQKNNIFDFFDNVVELTSEINYDTRIIRGFINSDEKNSIEGFENYYLESRYSIIDSEEAEELNSSYLLTIRTVLYEEE